jgi:hypothetical protein
VINQLIQCDKCGKALATVPTYHPGTRLPADHVHARRFVAMVLCEGDSSGHPAGSWFVRADCPDCDLGGGCLYLPKRPDPQPLPVPPRADLPADPLPLWERVRRWLQQPAIKTRSSGRTPTDPRK